MATIQNNNKLDDKIKDSLTNYEVSNETSDWARMEKMLNATPKATASEWSLVLNVFVGLAILTGGYFVYTKLNQPKSVEQTIPATEVKVENNNNTVISNPTVPETETNKTDAKEVMETTVKNENTVSKVENKNVNSVGKSIETKPAEAATETKSTVKPKIYIMGNQPVFGDMLDSSRGIIGDTKEKEETKKAAINHSEKPIGWSKFLNSDSLKKLKVERLKDSLNTNPKN